MKIVTTAALVAITALPASALGQTAACGEVDATIQRANAMRQEGRDDDAANLLRPLLTCGTNPRLQATLGLAELAAALWVQGYQHLSSALGATGDAWVTPRRATLQSALDQARSHIGYLQVTANVPNVELRIGGERVATLPMSGPVRVASGSLTYELSADGYVSELRRVEVAGNDVLTREHVLLTPRPREVARAAVTPVPVVGVAANSVPAVPVGGSSAPEGAPAPGSWMRTTGWVGVAGSAVLLGVGVGSYVGAANALNAYDSVLCTSASTTNNCVDARGRFETFYPLALTGFIAGGVVAVGSVALLIAAPSSGGERPRAWVPVCGPGPGTVGVSCIASF